MDFIEEPSNIYALKGENVEFYCQVKVIDYNEYRYYYNHGYNSGPLDYRIDDYAANSFNDYNNDFTEDEINFDELNKKLNSQSLKRHLKKTKEFFKTNYHPQSLNHSLSENKFFFATSNNAKAYKFRRTRQVGSNQNYNEHKIHHAQNHIQKNPITSIHWIKDGKRIGSDPDNRRSIHFCSFIFSSMKNIQI